MPYKLVILDFDGTLADSAGWFRGVINDIARRYRFRAVDEHELEELRGMDTRAILARLGVATWKLPFIARHVRKLMAERSDLQLFPGVHELLISLAERGVVTAIVSSNSEATVRSMLGPESAARVRFYACGAGLFGKRSKFRDVLRWSRIAPESAIAIGDEVRDIEAAQSVHVAAGAACWGYATPELLRAHAPTAMFESIDALASFLFDPSRAV